MVKFALYIFILLPFIGCKYEKGPKLTLRSKTHRLINSWTIEKVYVNGTDVTDQYTQWLLDYRIDFRKDNSYMITYDTAGPQKTYLEKGIWAFSDDKHAAFLTPYWNYNNWDTLPKKWRILRLKERSMWISRYVSDSGIVKEEEVHFK